MDDRYEVFIEFPQRQETNTAVPPGETARLTDVPEAGFLLRIKGWVILWPLEHSALKSCFIMLYRKRHLLATERNAWLRLRMLTGDLSCGRWFLDICI